MRKTFVLEMSFEYVLWVVFALEVDFELGSCPIAPSRRYGAPLMSAGWWASCSSFRFSDEVFVVVVACITAEVIVVEVVAGLAVSLLG